MVKKIVSFFVLWRLLLFLFAFLATFFIPFQKAFTAYNYGFSPPYYLYIWGNFDGYHYMEIAERGYKALEYSFFPLYPLFIRGLVWAFKIPYLLSGQLISTFALLLSLYVMAKLLALDQKRTLFGLFLLTIFTFSTSFFYIAVYNDSLFLLFSVLTIYFARKKSWLAASCFGALATLTRLNGLALFFLIIFEYIHVEKVKGLFSLKRILQTKLHSVVLIPSAFLGYLLYIQNLVGDWYVVFSSMKIWQQDKPVLPLQVFWRYLKILISPTLQFTYWIALAEVVFVFFYIAVLIYSFKKIRLSYWIFAVVSLLIPSLTGTFAGMPRYALHLYPFFLTLTLLLDQKGLLFKIVYFSVSIVGLFFMLAFFTRGYFVS